ncbi:hypothetical protein DWU98_21445, partial [Dyella monticola]
MSNPPRSSTALVQAAADAKQVFDGTDLVQWLGDTNVQTALSKLVCTFPTEWAADGIEQRYAWLKRTQPFVRIGEQSETPTLNETQWAAFEAHVRALCFWEQAKQAGYLDLDAVHWHVDPREFIKQFRKCGWLSEDEFRQFTPKFAPRAAPGVVYWESVSDPYKSKANQIPLPKAQLPHLNRVLRKFGITTPWRMACFFGNALQESSWLGGLVEKAPDGQRYAPWYGRGFLQLTWPKNYLDYWMFRGRGKQIPAELREKLLEAQKTADETRSNAPLQEPEGDLSAELKTWRGDVANPNRNDASLSAGFYWAKMNMARYADE